MMEKRWQQVQRIRQEQERWDATIDLATSGVLTPNFTTVGYQVVRQPASVHQRLKKALYDGFEKQKPKSDGHGGLRGSQGIASGLRREGIVDQIRGDVPGFVDISGLGRQLGDELKQMHEEWIGGIPLKYMQSYGLRVYAPGDTLTMHTDHMETHVVSSIIHVDRDVDEPWPIVIEGFDGVTREVDLKPGEMLFYESAKCVHGRPRPMKGRWYSSLFMHYRPWNWTLTQNSAKDVVELQWEKDIRSGRLPLPKDSRYPDMRLRGTGMYEPGCKNDWCSLSPVWPLASADGPGSAEGAGEGGADLPEL